MHYNNTMYHYNNSMFLLSTIHFLSKIIQNILGFDTLFIIHHNLESIKQKKAWIMNHAFLLILMINDTSHPVTK